MIVTRAVDAPVIVVDLGYGDAGKGTTVDWLCAQTVKSPQTAAPATVVRFNGGAQAAHHVIAPSGQPHRFAQFGAGTFTPGTRTFLSRFMLVDPLALVKEADHLETLGVPDPLSLVAIDRDALLTTPYHRAANQAREARRAGDRHGSCGMGIGETAAYAEKYPEAAPRVRDLTAPRILERKLTQLRDYLASELAALPGTFSAGEPEPADVAEVYRAVADRVTLTGDGYLKRRLRQGHVIFEGAQGVLLDQWRGFHPYTTWSTTTFENAETLLQEAGNDAGVVRLGVTRTYQTRHGPGPFPTEDLLLDLPEPRNADGRWQGPFRVGHLDAVTLKYAVDAAGGVDAVALTHLDTAREHAGDLRIGWGYDIDGIFVNRIALGPPRDLEHQQQLTATLLRARPRYDRVERRTQEEWADTVADILHAPVVLRSHGPAITDKSLPTRAAVSR